MEEGKTAFVYWCDGTGHAARALPVLREMRERGIETCVAGGGPGSIFVDLNGFEQPGLTHVAVKGDNPIHFLKHTLTDLIPSSVKRFREIWGWLKEEDPEKVITDDIFALAAASIQRRETYRIDHLSPGLLEPFWDIQLRIYDKLSLLTAEQIIVTSLWPEEEISRGFTKVPPLAQEGEPDDEIEPYDVLINPGTHGDQFGKIKKELEEKDLDVREVGDDNWKTKKTMTPYTEKAEVVICTGFSSIADAVVPGTPCIILPFLPFQRSIAEKAEETVKGVHRAENPEQAIKKAEKICQQDNPETPEFQNGDRKFVNTVHPETETDT